MNFTTPDSMIAAASYVNREYGLTGYRIAQHVLSQMFCVRHTDGSEFLLVADNYGRVTVQVDGESATGLLNRHYNG